jgi:TonB family protein
MSPPSLHAEDSLHSFDRRRYARQSIHSLCYLDLGPANGGIVINISEGGLAVHAVGILVDTPILQMHFQLPQSHEQLEATGQVAWTSESKREAGIHFIDLPEKARVQIKQWLFEQPPSAESQMEGESVSEKKNQVLEMRPVRDEKTPVPEPAVISGMTNEAFESLFPSEKNLAARREVKSSAAISAVPVSPSAAPNVSAFPSESARPTRLEANAPTIDSLSALERSAHAARERIPEMPSLPSTTPAHVITNEELVAQVPSEKAVLPQSHSPATLSVPVTPISRTPGVLPPFSHSDQAIHESVVEAPVTQPLGAMRISDAEIASPLPTESVLPEPLVFGAPIENSPPALPISGETDTVPPSTAGAAPAWLGSDSPMEVRPPSAETSSSAEILRDLRATLSRAGAIHKSPARHEAAKYDSQILPPPDNAAPLSPVVTAPATSARSAAASPALAGIPLPQPEKPAPAQPQVKSPLTGILSDPLVSGRADKRLAQSSKQLGDFTRDSRPTRGARWHLTAAFVFVLVVLLGIGIAFERGMFDVVSGGADSSTNNSLAQATPTPPNNSVKVPEPQRVNQEVGRNTRRELESARGAFSGSAGKQHQQALGSPTSKPEKPKTFVWTLSPPVGANRAFPGGTTEKVSPPAVQVQPDIASGVSIPSGVAGSWNAFSKLAPPQPPSQPAPQLPEQGDRLVASSLLYRVEPLYPAEAAQKHVEGTVKLRAVIGRDGRVMGLGLVSGPPSLVPAAMRAAREWRYIPALLNGEPVESETDIAIEFWQSHKTNR